VLWSIQRLTSAFDISGFDCGEVSLNSFLQRHALSNDKAGLGRTFIAIEAGQAQIAGYFTMSTGSVRFDVIPDHAKKRLPKYPIPTIHIGRLAVDVKFQGKGLGETLLVEALRKAATASSSVGVYAIDVIALHDRAKSFYLRYGFVEMLDQPLHLFLSIAAARALAKIIDE
jgi:ribosomal protein S18 acetylase RimI-like enzyme